MIAAVIHSQGRRVSADSLARTGISQFASGTDSTVSECIMWPQKSFCTVCKAFPLNCWGGGRGVVCKIAEPFKSGNILCIMWSIVRHLTSTSYASS